MKNKKSCLGDEDQGSDEVREPASLRWANGLLVMLCAAAFSCGGEAPDEVEDRDAVMEGVVTNIIPASSACDRGAIKPSWCISTPPATVDSKNAARFVVDGKRDPKEYGGGVTLPYTDWMVKAGGTVHAKAWRLKPQIGAKPGLVPLGRTNNQLQIYLENIPFYSKDVRELCLFVDNNRFSGTTTTAGSEDRVYCVDMNQGTNSKVLRPGYLGKLQQVSEWFPVSTPTCAPDPSKGTVMRCSAELTISLPDSAFVAPDLGLDPGIGFAILATGVPGNPSHGSMPEAITQSVAPTAPWADRRKALTLLLGPPQGFAKSYMTWNVRRSSIDKLAGEFSVVDDEDIGLFLAGHQPWSFTPHDIVAIQEGWNEDQMAEVFDTANHVRISYGLGGYNTYGPVDFELTVFRKFVNEIAKPFVGDEGTTGGLWILSPLPDGGKSFHSFKACKGEDCFKAKGVQWVRLMLNPPTPENTDQSKCAGSSSQACEPPPSGGDYVDVFNTHLQADDPRLCKDVFLKDSIWSSLGALAATITDPFEIGVLEGLKKLAQNDWNCGMSDEEVRALQLEEMNAFISSHAVHPATGLPDRPAIIMGDFNIDGSKLGSEYQRMLETLTISPPNSVYGQPATDLLNPWPFDFDWDIDHGDIALERGSQIDFSTGKCAGTYIGSTGGKQEDTCDFAGKWNGDQRFDYVLVRPPYLPNHSSYAATTWVAGKKEGEDPGVWFSPFPSFGSYGAPPERLSDHKPVTATIEHVKLRYPPLYHAQWNHEVVFRVTSADGSNHGDCWTCGAVDPQVMRGGLRLHNGQNEWRMYKAWGSTCQNNATVSWPADSCTNDWNYSDKQILPADTAHTFFAALYDDDDSSSNDAMYTFSNEEWPQQAIDWVGGWVRMRGYKDPSRKFSWIPDWPIRDSDPIPQSTGSSPTSMTLLCSFAELPPGEQ